jgi:hypothetical protein
VLAPDVSNFKSRLPSGTPALFFGFFLAKASHVFIPGAVKRKPGMTVWFDYAASLPAITANSSMKLFRNAFVLASVTS